MNKNCIILEIRKQFNLDPDATPPGSLCVRVDVWPVLQYYDSPCELHTEDEAAVKIDRLNREYPESRFQVVVIDTPRLIEIAPKNGGYLLLFSANGYHTDRFWVIGGWDEYSKEWVSLEERTSLTPTHWLPLPPAP